MLCNDLVHMCYTFPQVLSVNSTVVRCWTGRPESASHPAVAVQDDLTGQLSHPATLAGHRFKGQDVCGKERSWSVKLQ